ncbi:lipopolysaccharide biosynthesis protein [Carnobacterium inhibens]|uniref:lipopolysaccharide biosynthesis protein n=1 Tax=Carnobacterium inhibens TaxID=147709 RepID=UPI00203BBB5C|nr:oligosaccharide flippase family protein [Carnobacterium inhibens]MCM3511377.1 oligosaccharide flippase family protein [Carnobacterium inhibens]
MSNNSLVKKSGIYFIGNLSSKMMSAILIPIYAFYINTKDLGTYDFSQTIMGILSPIIILAVWEAVLKFLLSEDDLIKQRKIISTSAIFSIGMSLVFIIIAIIYKQIIGINIRYFEMIIIMIVLYTLVHLWQYYARGTSNNKLYVLAGVVSTIVNFICIIIFVVIFKMGLLGLLLAYNIGQISIIVVIEKKLKLISKLKINDFEFLILKRMLIFSSPLVLNLTFSWFISGFGKTIITLRLGPEANGLYSFANKFSLIISMIGSVITMAIIEEAILSVKSKEIDGNFSKTLQKLFLIFLSIAILAVPAIIIFYNVISDTEYYDSLVYAPWLLIYAVASTMASNIGSVFQAIEKTQYQFTTTLLGGAATIIISWALIGKFGIFAVVFGQIVGAFTMMISRYILINHFITMRLDWKPIILLSIIFITVVIVALNTHFIVSILIEILTILLIFKYNKKTVLTLLGRFNK